MRKLTGILMVGLFLCASVFAGTGTENDPYTIAEALALSEGTTEYWAQGYIVGGRYDDFELPCANDYGIKGHTPLQRRALAGPAFFRCGIRKETGAPPSRPLLPIAGSRIADAPHVKRVKLYRTSLAIGLKENRVWTIQGAPQ